MPNPAVANAIWKASVLPDWWRWRQAVETVRGSQEALLLRCVARNAGTEFGQEHGFSRIRTVQDFQKAVPIRDYAALKRWVDRVADGHRNVLTAEPVVCMVPSSGSTAASKLIPYTASLTREFRRGIGPWMFELFRTHPAAASGCAYWSISPASQSARVTAAGVRIGLEDSEYLGWLSKMVQNAIFAVPPKVGTISNIETFRYVTLRFLLQRRDLALISVWNPTFLMLLLEPLAKWRGPLLEDIGRGMLNPDLNLEPATRRSLELRLRLAPGRAKELELILGKWAGSDRPGDTPAEKRSVYEEIWPQLKLISCWCDGASVVHSGHLKQCFPNTAIQPKGLISTEGFVSFPCNGHEGAALAVTSHFLEFESLDRPEVALLAHQLEKGRRYGVILTTGGGLYRYRLHDFVEVTGFLKECPRVRFVGRGDRTVDLFGEKLNELHVQRVVEEELRRRGIRPRFWMVAPEATESAPGGYMLFLQAAGKTPQPDMLADMQETLDVSLKENFHYDYARRLGQLMMLRIYLINTESVNAAEMYLSECERRGMKLGDIKPCFLHGESGWERLFPGKVI